MADLILYPQLPASGFGDGDRIIDPQGNIWEWDAETDAWIVRGKADLIPDATEGSDGLVTPEVFRKIRLIQDLISQGVPFAPFKLKSRVHNPYFYYFQSSDGLIRFTPEGDGILRMEIDRARLYAMIVSKCCVGPKGKVGEQGIKGLDGRVAPNEVFRLPISVSEDVFEIDTTAVPAPIDTPISIRVYDADDEEIAEVTVAVDGSSVAVAVDEGFEIAVTDLEASYEPTSERLTARIPFSTVPDGQDINRWRYKARQRGRQGSSGEDGKALLEVVDRLVEDNALESPEAIVSLRRAGTTDLRTLASPMHTDICVSSLSAVEGNLTSSNLLSSRLVAAEITTRDCKAIGHFDVKENFVDRLSEASPLDLPSWTPSDGCGQRSRWSAFRFNWWDFTGSDLRYMFKITPTKRPPEKCCVAGDMLIHCEDGLRRLDSLKVGDRVLGPGGSLLPITHFFDNGIKECVKLTFSDGSQVVCTPDHQFVVGGHKIEAKDLQPWDLIPKASGMLDYVRESKPGTYKDRERGFAIGSLLGDGWISDKGVGVSVSEEDAEIAEQVVEYVNGISGSKRSVGVGSESMVRACWDTDSSCASRLLKGGGWYKSLLEDRMDIPESVYSETFEFYRGFFAGIVSTDGCVRANGYTNVLSSVSKGLVGCVKVLLDYLGIRSTIKLVPQSENGGVVKGRGRGYLYQLELRSSSEPVFWELVNDSILERKSRDSRPGNKDWSSGFVDPVDGVDEDDVDLGVIAGAFLYYGGYNLASGRAWISDKMPGWVRERVADFLECDVPISGNRFWKTMVVAQKIAFVYAGECNRGFCMGVLRVIFARGARTQYGGGIIINRSREVEASFVSSCLDTLGIKHRVQKVANPLFKEGYALWILIGQRVHRYNALMMAGRRDLCEEVVGVGVTLAPDVVRLVSRESVGERHVFDYTVPPHMMMAVQGLWSLDCESDFYFCPNVGDEPCGISGSNPSLPPTLEMPKRFQEQCICDCDDPIEMELQSGGYFFDPIDATTDSFTSGTMASEAVESVLDGSTDEYHVDVIVGSPTTIGVKIEPSPEVCGGAAKTRNGCAFRDVKKIHSVAVIEDLSGNAVLKSPQVVEIEAYPSKMEFVLDTRALPAVGEGASETKLESRVRISLRVNSTNIEACQGYRVVVAAVKGLGEKSS